jgi:predicted Zn-dependent peptidase
MREYQAHTLSNGIRIIHHQVKSTKIVHCGIMLDIGSRDETNANQGIAHFWEHMAFKGTRKRRAFHILNRLESLGGELNAFTDKEKILFYASLRSVYFDRAMELLTDITFDSVFPANQIDRERNVILEEMAMYFDDPEDSLQDEFDHVVFNSHPLGMNILGTQKTVGAFKRSDFRKFIKDHFDTRRIIFSSVGDISFDQVVKLSEKYMGRLPRHVSRYRRKGFSNYKPGEVVLRRPIKQARCAIGRTAYSLKDSDRTPFYLLTNILGGSGLNSRLNMALREKRGFVYSIGAHFVPFTDTGLFVISFGTEPQQLKKSVELVKQELKKLRREPLGVKQLKSSKEQIIGQVTMAHENNLNLMIMMARNLLDLGRINSIEELTDRIQVVQSKDLKRMANEMFDESMMSYLFMEPN